MHRARLEALLARGSESALTLVSAPAGFGKSTLLAGWLASTQHRCTSASVSLEERDRDPTTFWTYVVLAVDRATGTVTAEAALAHLQSGQPLVERVLTPLLNGLSVMPDDLHLVLDDYHLAESPDVHEGMVFFLDHLPPQVHLVISTRVDPALALARLRAPGQLVEVRASQLRFTADETAAYLNDVNALGLDGSDVTTLHARTEGWAAAQQLAALALHERDDRSRFIAGFAGDDRFVVDYLADEVLDRLSAATRRFLLETSVLDRLTGPLCDAVTRGTGGAAVLSSLDRQSLPRPSRRRSPVVPIPPPVRRRTEGPADGGAAEGGADAGVGGSGPGRARLIEQLPVEVMEDRPVLLAAP